MTEHRASWAAAWRALGRPEYGRDEAEMSEGRLRVRVKAWEREQAWAPAYVATELQRTAEAAARHRQDAVMAAARAEVETDDARRQELLDEAEQRAALADVLDEAERQLDLADEGRGAWYAHTAPTRQAAERAAAELADRGIDTKASDEQVTAAEWLEAERQARIEDDSHRPITEASFARPQPADEPREDAAPAEPETPADARDDLPAGVPTPAETAMAALRARDALDRIAARTAEERDHAAEADDQTQRELAWRHADAQATEAEDADVI